MNTIHMPKLTSSMKKRETASYMRFIKLNWVGPRETLPVYINPGHIVHIAAVKASGTTEVSITNSDMVIQVLETPEEILKLIREEE